CRLALEVPDAAHQVFNIGSGNHYTVQAIAEAIARVLNKEYIEPEITENYRVGDIRHCFADISLARQVLGYAPRVSLDEGLAELSEWLAGQQAVDLVAKASAELRERGLTV
ncbi:MAG TPA: nucleoside-diphosphate-sugar epimerase, partial [Verrucomicrobiae bacterium]